MEIASTRFSPGHIPWNKGMKGIHLSPGSEFKKGRIPTNKLPVGTVTLRKRNRDGRTHAWAKVAEPNVWMQRHRLVWEEHNGPLAKGLVIHRLDGDSLNDDINNLVAMSRAEHIMIHRPEFEEKRIASASKAALKRWKEHRESQYDTYYWQE